MARLSPPPPLCRATAPGGESVAVWHCPRHSAGAGPLRQGAAFREGRPAMRRRPQGRQRAGSFRSSSSMLACRRRTLRCAGGRMSASEQGSAATAAVAVRTRPTSVAPTFQTEVSVGPPSEAPPGAFSAAAGASKVARFRAHGRPRDAWADACPPASKGLPAPVRDGCRLSGRRRPVLPYVNRSGSCGGEAGVSRECDGPASSAAAGGRAMIWETRPKPRGQ